ncbi:MAG: HAMP domain-containing protein [Paludibacteraceae bacterium]|nr:HAMP domain-containing protein [Paludibacteraceae bacterium]
MKYKQYKISSLLLFSVIIHVIFVIVIGLISVMHANDLHKKTEYFYTNSLSVRVAVNTLKNEITSMRLGVRDMMLARNYDEQSLAEETIAKANANALQQFQVLRTKYTGPQSDVELAFEAFNAWSALLYQNNASVKNDKSKINDVIDRVKATGRSGQLREILFHNIEQINVSSTNISTNVYNDSIKLRAQLNMELYILIFLILTISVFINYHLLRHIRDSITSLTLVAQQLQNGDLNARSNIDKGNEFGLLSDTFNNLASRVQQNINLGELEKKLSNAMLRETDAQHFFAQLLPELATNTQSQIVACYLLNKQKQEYTLFHAVGVHADAQKTYSAKQPEGELAMCIITRKIQKISKIPHDTSFIFNTLTGDIVPREIICIPLLVDDEVVAVISLAAVRKFSETAELLIYNIHDTLNARVEGVLAYRQLEKFSERLEQQSIELEEKNKTLEIQKEQLHEVNELKTRFLSGMSHELRTPLNSIIALSGVLARGLTGKIDNELFGYLPVIERNGKHLLTIINDILDYSRIETGREEIIYTHVKLSDLMENICEAIRPIAHEKGIIISCNLQSTDVEFDTDEKKFRHILQNILANAVKFTSEGKVEIFSSKINDQLRIEVTDTGIGIAPEHIQHIFDEFRQADNSTSRRFGGTGLGLAIAKKYAEMLGGNISVKSTVGEGSVFTVSIKLKE